MLAIHLIYVQYNLRLVVRLITSWLINFSALCCRRY